MPDPQKPNCHECRHRGTVLGSCHSSCHHPEVKSAHDDPMLGAFAILAGVGRVDPMVVKALGVTGHPHGIRSGWFNWPWNFDPTWLLTCTGFAAREVKTDA